MEIRLKLCTRGKKRRFQFMKSNHTRGKPFVKKRSLIIKTDSRFPFTLFPPSLSLHHGTPDTGSRATDQGGKERKKESDKTKKGLCNKIKDVDRCGHTDDSDSVRYHAFFTLERANAQGDGSGHRHRAMGALSRGRGEGVYERP